MVKDGMKHNKDNASFQKLMNNRQLALKLIANVTYGYTSASYSGRMPCVEIADSIVQSARETLESAIELIKTTKEWGAEVVYGDTDSLFIHFPGKTKDQAFDIGQEIAKTVTNMNPEPVKLKFEKVYYPCILQTKKRYVGYMYESKAQKIPVFDAKGMETIRRDGTPAQQKMEEKSLRLLFDTCDLSQIKEYFEEQWMKIMTGKVSIQDFCFAKEVKLGTYKGLGPPGAKVAIEKIKEDEYGGPQYRERVPYVVIAGMPNDRLIDRCVSPEVLINNPGINLDSEYYITKNLIPPLERIFKLLGANIRQWYDEMPKAVKFHQPSHQIKGQHGYNLRNYLKDSSCQAYDLSRLDAELKLAGEYGLRNKREIYRIGLQLSKIRRAARDLLTRDEKDPKRLFEGNALIRRLVRIGVLSEDKMKLDYVLALRVEDFLERRLQTQVFKLGLAKSVHHARVLIKQRHIRVGKQIVNVPSFTVRLDSQKHIDFAATSPYGGGRPGRVKRKHAAAAAAGGDEAAEDEE
ncbi:hypothetical protein DV454_002976 [Geotrichum candidum]|nr:hypothetical protein DV454_002976 [Geotrichum candidum]